MKSRLAFGPVAALGLALLLAAACTGQGEGQRCQRANNISDDCKDGLTCIAAPNGNADVCCPADPRQATEEICKQAPVTPGSDASIPDTGTPDTGADSAVKDGASDAADGSSGDASPDGASDGSSDGSSDAADSGG